MYLFILLFAISFILSGSFLTLTALRVLKLNSQQNNTTATLKKQKISGLILLVVGFMLLLTYMF